MGLKNVDISAKNGFWIITVIIISTCHWKINMVFVLHFFFCPSQALARAMMPGHQVGQVGTSRQGDVAHVPGLLKCCLLQPCHCGAKDGLDVFVCFLSMFLGYLSLHRHLVLDSWIWFGHLDGYLMIVGYVQNCSDMLSVVFLDSFWICSPNDAASRGGPRLVSFTSIMAVM